MSSSHMFYVINRQWDQQRKYVMKVHWVALEMVNRMYDASKNRLCSCVSDQHWEAFVYYNCNCIVALYPWQPNDYNVQKWDRVCVYQLLPPESRSVSESASWILSTLCYCIQMLKFRSPSTTWCTQKTLLLWQINATDMHHCLDTEDVHLLE